MPNLYTYQNEILPNHLYRIRKLNDLMSHQQVNPNIMVKGSVNIYGYNGKNFPTTKTDMFLPKANEDVQGFAAFEIIPAYIYCEGTATEIVLSGIEVLEDCGEFEE